jgi:hypothetical protein
MKCLFIFAGSHFRCDLALNFAWQRFGEGPYLWCGVEILIVRKEGKPVLLPTGMGYVVLDVLFFSFMKCS